MACIPQTQKNGAFTVLVVDDKPVNLRVVFEALRDEGYRVLVAEDGASALKQATKVKPDMVLLDIMMPGMSGIETCRKLKLQPETAGIPVIFMTALSDSEDKTRAFAAGGVDFISKPLDHAEVLARVRTHLEIRRTQVDVDTHMDFLSGLGKERTRDALFSRYAAFLNNRPDHADLVAVLIQPNPDAPLRLEYLGYGNGVDGERLKTKQTGEGSWMAFLSESAMDVDGQINALDSTQWNVPGPLAELSIKSFVASGFRVNDHGKGILLTCYSRSIELDRSRRLKWHRILACYLGSAWTNAAEWERMEESGRRLSLENEYLREEAREKADIGGIIGESFVLRKALNEIDLVAPTEANVLLTGESGTGKELMARRIHELSGRRVGPLVKVNCASIPKELFESEFFGHCKGAFTGAVKSRVGRFLLADGGTLFLDEVGEIPMDLQSKLLRVLQEETFEPVGEDKTIEVNVRVIAATNRDLERECREGRFRQDLYYRLSVFPICIPPLRERVADVPLLVNHFVESECRKFGYRVIPVAPEVMRILESYEWPGNIRELQNVVARAVILSGGRELRFVLPGRDMAAVSSASGSAMVKDFGLGVGVLNEEDMAVFQRENLQRALVQAGGRIEGEGSASILLGLHPNTLRSRLKSFGIKVGGKDSGQP